MSVWTKCGARASVWVWACLVLLSMSNTPAEANGIHTSSEEVFGGLAGPYQVEVFASSSTDNLHLIIGVLDRSGDLLIDQPFITILAHRPENIDGQRITLGPFIAVSSSEGLQWFVADLPIQQLGEWTLTLTIDGPMAQEAIEFPVYIDKPDDATWSTITILILIFIATFAYLGWRRLRMRRLKDSI